MIPKVSASIMMLSACRLPRRNPAFFRIQVDGKQHLQGCAARVHFQPNGNISEFEGPNRDMEELPYHNDPAPHDLNGILDGYRHRWLGFKQGNRLVLLYCALSNAGSWALFPTIRH
jgi:hypothetical protein